MRIAPTTKSPLVVIVTGPVGAGKTTTAIALSDHLETAGVAHAMIDMDHLSWVWPAAPDDRFNTRLAFRNLANMAIAYREHGVGVLVIAGVIEEEADRARYQQAIPGAHVVIVRLRVPLSRVADQLHGRDSGDSLAWSLNRALELEGIMDAAGIGSGEGDMLLEVDGAAPDEVAKMIATGLGLTFSGMATGDCS